MHVSNFVKVRHITPEILDYKLEKSANHRRFLEEYGMLKPQIKALIRLIDKEKYNEMKEIFIKYNLIDLFDELK